jgi:hypothetical protein
MRNAMPYYKPKQGLELLIALGLIRCREELLVFHVYRTLGHDEWRARVSDSKLSAS